MVTWYHKLRPCIAAFSDRKYLDGEPFQIVGVLAAESADEEAQPMFVVDTANGMHEVFVDEIFDYRIKEPLT